MIGAGQLVLESVACRRGGRLLFENLSCRLGPGEAVLVRGPNGAGKSSLLRLIAGLLTVEHGTITLSGRLGLAADAGFLDGRKPLAKALAFWAGLDRSSDAAVPKALLALGIAHLADVPIRILSTGQKKRAVLAAIIASGAGIWLLDEPANGLDVDSVVLLEAAIATHRASGGITVIASHQNLLLPDVQEIVLGAS